MADRQNKQRRPPAGKPRDADLDEALEESFPASDPLPTSPITGVRAGDEPPEGDDGHDDAKGAARAHKTSGCHKTSGSGG